MRTLHPAYRVTDLGASVVFYTALGYSQVGRVDLGEGASLTMLKFPSDEFVALELVHRPGDGPVDIGTGFSHLAVQIDNLKATVEALTQAGLRPGPIELPGGPDGSPTPTAIGSSWSNGHPGIPMASPRPTSLSQQAYRPRGRRPPWWFCSPANPPESHIRIQIEFETCSVGVARDSSFWTSLSEIKTSSR